VLLPASQQPCASDACRFRTWLQSHFDASGVVGKPLVLEEYGKPWDEVKRNEMFKMVQVCGCCLHHLIVFTVHVCSSADLLSMPFHLYHCRSARSW
jgi:hypothetical protein